MLINKKYWLNCAKIVDWKTHPQSCVKKINKINNWYPEGELTVYENCITRHIKKNKTAIITINKFGKIKKYSHYKIDSLTNKLAFQILKKVNLKKKDKSKVMIHSCATIYSALSMLSCAKLCLSFSVIFEELEEKSILERIKIFQPKIFLTRQDRISFVKKYPKVYKLFNPNDLIFLNENYLAKSDYHKVENYTSKSNDLFFSLFTSGSTGQPKGVNHTYGGYFVYSLLTCREKFGINSNSIVLTASDAGWINGHTYALFGPLGLGATTILLESPLLTLRIEILKKILKLKTTVLYLPVTVIRLMRNIYSNIKPLKRHNLKTIGSMGEPLASSIGSWLANFFNIKKAIINTYFQTETGGIICSPSFKQNMKSAPNGSVGEPMKNIKINKLDDKKKEIKILSLWPGCMSGIINKDKNLWKKYWDKNNHFRMFDYAIKNNNNIYIYGRTDDVINVRGHRIGSAEIESIVLSIKEIKETACISIPDDLEGNRIDLYVVSKYSNCLDLEISKAIKENFGTYAIPKNIFFVKELPKTRSGKILRRLLRDMSINKKIITKNYSTILNKKVINKIQDVVRNTL